jgi:hypothetical protein
MLVRVWAVLGLVLPTVSLAPTACDGLIRVGSGGEFIDPCARTRFFHGLNAVEKGFPYIPSQTFTQDGGSLSAEDAALWASLGFNVVRLGVMWAGAAPVQRGEFNHTYLLSLARLSQSLYEAQGIYTFLDAHQDGFSEWFCDDGAPVWAAKEYSLGAPGFPMPLAPPINSSANCASIGSIPWGELYLTNAVGRAFQTLYATRQGQQDFGAFWGATVTAFAGVQGVLGWELLNEPWAGDVLADPLRILPSVADATLLGPFFSNVTNALRSAEAAAGAPHRIVFSEPVTWDNFFPVGFAELPGGEGSRGLSYHYYELPDIVGYAWQVDARAQDASRLGGAGILSEFECVAAAVLFLALRTSALHPPPLPFFHSPASFPPASSSLRSIGLQSPVNTPYTELDMRGTMDTVDSVGHSWIGWAAPSIWLGNKTLFAANIRELARPYARAVAGRNATFAFHVGSVSGAGNFTLSYTLDPLCLGPTEVFVPTGLWWARAGLSVQVSPPGAPLALEWEWVEGQVSLPAHNAPTSLPPLPFAHAFLRITPTAPSAGLRVTVTVESSSMDTTK